MLKENGGSGRCCKGWLQMNIFKLFLKVREDTEPDLKDFQQYWLLLLLLQWFRPFSLLSLPMPPTPTLFNQARCFQKSQLKTFWIFSWSIPAWHFFLVEYLHLPDIQGYSVCDFPKQLKERCFSEILACYSEEEIALKMSLRSVSATYYESTQS